jgi:RNA polymerase sigma factor (sigma-70 family)
MEVSALRYSGASGLHARSPLLRLQSDERLVAMIRRGNQPAFELLVSRYHTRLLSFCRHLLGSREDAEDVLQDVLAAAYNAMVADDRPLNVKPWLYRIARNRCLNHLRRTTAIGVDSMDVHLAEHGTTTADKVHGREEFRQLVSDIGGLPETQRTALILREMDALTYEQIAEAMDTTVSSVKSLLVRARVSLTEAAEARLLSCEEVREELAEVTEGLRRKISPPARRHVKSCARCEVFHKELHRTNRALAALIPIGPLALLRKAVLFHAIGHSAAGSAGAAGVSAVGTGSGTGAAGAGAVGAAGASGVGAAAGAGAAGAAGAAGSGGLISAGVGAVATKAAAGIAAAAIFTAGTVAVSHHVDAGHANGLSATTIVNRSVTSGLEQAASGNAGIVGAVAGVSGASTAGGRAGRRAKLHARSAAKAIRTQTLLERQKTAADTPAPALTNLQVGGSDPGSPRAAGTDGPSPASTGTSAPVATGGVSTAPPSGAPTAVTSATTPTPATITPTPAATTPTPAATTPTPAATTPAPVTTDGAVTTTTAPVTTTATAPTTPTAPTPVPVTTTPTPAPVATTPTPVPVTTTPTPTATTPAPVTTTATAPTTAAPTTPPPLSTTPTAPDTGAATTPTGTTGSQGP